jgi:ElaB/YqjD/DUF883 family membrane-anchored ribosome-binding protein
MVRYLLAMVLAAAIVMPGCGKSEENSSSPSTPKAGTPDATSLLGAAKQMAESIDTSQYVAQLSGMSSQVEKLKTTAKAKADAQLNKLVDQIADKLATVQKKIETMKNAEGGTAKAMMKEVENLMPELQKLMDQAMARVKELGVSM